MNAFSFSESKKVQRKNNNPYYDKETCSELQDKKQNPAVIKYNEVMNKRNQLDKKKDIICTRGLMGVNKKEQ